MELVEEMVLGYILKRNIYPSISEGFFKNISSSHLGQFEQIGPYSRQDSGFKLASGVVGAHYVNSVLVC